MKVIAAFIPGTIAFRRPLSSKLPSHPVGRQLFLPLPPRRDSQSSPPHQCNSGRTHCSLPAPNRNSTSRVAAQCNTGARRWYAGHRWRRRCNMRDRHRRRSSRRPAPPGSSRGHTSAARDKTCPSSFFCACPAFSWPPPRRGGWRRAVRQRRIRRWCGGTCSAPMSEPRHQSG